MPDLKNERRVAAEGCHCRQAGTADLAVVTVPASAEAGTAWSAGSCSAFCVGTSTVQGKGLVHCGAEALYLVPLEVLLRSEDWQAMAVLQACCDEAVPRLFTLHRQTRLRDSADSPLHCLCVDRVAGELQRRVLDGLQVVVCEMAEKRRLRHSLGSPVDKLTVAGGAEVEFREAEWADVLRLSLSRRLDVTHRLEPDLCVIVGDHSQ